MGSWIFICSLICNPIALIYFVTQIVLACSLGALSVASCVSLMYLYHCGFYSFGELPYFLALQVAPGPKNNFLFHN